MRFYNALLNLYPRRFRERFGEGMRRTFVEDLAAASARGRWTRFVFLTGTAIEALWFGAAERLSWRTAMRGLFSIDVRDAFRSLRATPVITLVAVVSLALGIGANTALFSIVNGLFFKPLPVHEPQQLAMVGDGSWTNPAWEALRDRADDAFESATAWSYDSFDLAEAGATEVVDGSYVSGDFFRTLGVSPLVGRTIVAADDRRGNSELPAVISYRLWKQRFGGRVDVLGQPLTVNRAKALVIGVMPPGFFGADVGRIVDVYLPIAGEAIVMGERSALDKRQNFWLAVAVRLKSGTKPGASLVSAATALSVLAPQVKAASMPPERTTAADRDGFMEDSFVVTSLATGRSIFRSGLEQPLTIIMCVVGAVLLIACANIANVLLARATARRHEMSVRLALGASRVRIARQLLIESFLLAATGAAAGLLLARAAGAMLVSQFTFRTLSVTLDLNPDWRVFAFTSAVTAITTLLFGLAPAAGVSSLSPQAALKEQSRNVSGDRRVSVRHGLVVLQVALSLALAVGAGLFVRTFAILAATPLGFDPSRLLVVTVNLGRSGVAPEARLGEYERLRDAAAAVPGVRNVALSFMTPLSGRSISTGVERPGMHSAPDKEKFQRVMVNNVSPEFFDTYGSRLLAGRAFDRGDSAGAAPVAIVNETLARKLFGDSTAIGRDLVGNVGVPGATRFSIVGVVSDTLYRSARAGMEPVAYVPMPQAGIAGSSASLTISVAGATDTVERDLSATIARALPAATLSVRPFGKQIRSTFSQERLLAQLSGFFGVLSVLLAGVGLYGVTSYSVSRRRGEIAIRMALGSSADGVVRLVLIRVVALVVIGAALGAAMSAWASRFVGSLLFGVPPGDLVTLGIAAIVMISIGLIAGWLPARRASRLDPVVVLRE